MCAIYITWGAAICLGSRFNIAIWWVLVKIKLSYLFGTHDVSFRSDNFLVSTYPGAHFLVLHQVCIVLSLCLRHNDTSTS